MSMTVFKYEIPVADEPTIRLPEKAKILSVGEQRGNIYLWALIDPGIVKTERRTFRVAGTGHELTEVETLTFIGTVHMADGALIFHVFERTHPWA